MNYRELDSPKVKARLTKQPRFPVEFLWTRDRINFRICLTNPIFAAYKEPFFWIDSEGCFMDFFLCVIGMVMIVEGFPYFAFPKRMKFWVTRVLEMAEGTLQRFGLILMILGLFLVYFGKK